MAGKANNQEDLVEALWALKREHENQAKFYQNMYRDLLDCADRLDHIPVRIYKIILVVRGRGAG